MGCAANRPRERDARTSTGRTRRLDSGRRRPAGPASLFSRSTAFAARSRRAAAGLLAVALLLGAAPAALAQTSEKLVGNTGQGTASGDDNERSFNRDHAQAFTTGSNAWGYKLTSVGIELDVILDFNTGEPAYSVSIRSADGNNTTLGTLTNPASVAAGVNTFSASGDGIDLAADTTYYVIVDVSTAGDRVVRMRQTSSNNEDANAASGWSIGDGSRRKGRIQSRPNVEAWDTATKSNKIAIHGQAVVAPAGAPTGGRIERDRLTLTFPERLDPWSRPAGSAFRVVQGGMTVARGAGPAAVAGTEVTVVLDRAVPAGAATRVQYTKPAAHAGAHPRSGPLRTAAGGGEVADFTLPVAAARVTATPRFESAAVSGTTLTITFDEALNPSARPLNRFFGLVHGETAILGITAQQVAISGRTVTVTLQSAPVPGVPYTLTYLTKGNAADQRLQGTQGNEVAPFSGKAVTNNTPDTTGPRLAAAPDGPGTIDGTTLTWVFDEALDDSVAVPPARIQWTVSGVQKSATSVEISGRTVTATFATPVGHDDRVFTHYQPQAGDPKLRDLSTPPNEASVFTNKVVTNNTPPAFSSATVDGTVLAITFDGALDGSSTPAPDAFHVTVGGTRVDLEDTGGVSIGGSLVTLALADPVISTDTVKVRYTQPADNPLRDNDNAKRPVATFADQDVTNSTADATPPGFVSATVNGAVLKITFDEALDETSEPPAQFFVPRVAGQLGTTTDISITGRIVTLTLAQAVTHGQTVQVSYTPTGNLNLLKDRSGNRLAGFQRNTVTNNTPPAFSSAAVDGASLTITFDGGLDSGSVPAAGDFAVTVSGSAADLVDTDPVTVNGAVVTLTLVAAVLASDTVKVRYTQPADSPLRDADNAMRPVATFADQDVTNSTSTAADTTLPQFVSATVNGAVLKITFDEALDETSEPPARFFIPRVAGQLGTATDISITGRIVTLTLAQAVTHGQTVQVSYTPTGDLNLIKDRSGNRLAGFQRNTVTNNTPPAFSSAAVDGASLTITFDGGLDSGSVPAAGDFAVTVSGSAADLVDTDPVTVNGAVVTLTLVAAVLDSDTVKVRYTQPDDSPLRDADNAMRPVATFADQDVSNSTAADATPPGFVSATVNGAVLKITFDEALDETSEPPAQFFIPRVAGQLGTTTDISITGRIVTLTLAQAVTHGQTVQVSYTPTGDLNLLKDRSGNRLAGFQRNTVTNNTPPAFSSAAVDGASLTITFDGGLDSGSVPAAGDFAVTVSGSAADLADTDPVTVNGAVVTLTLASRVREVDTVTVGYMAPQTNPLKDADNAMLPVPGFSGETVANNTGGDTVAPEFSSAARHTARQIVVTFDEALAPAPRLANGAFRVRAGTQNQPLTGAPSVAGATVTLGTQSDLPGGGTITVRYIKPSTPGTVNKLRDAAGNEVATFANPDFQPVSGTAAAPGAPTDVTVAEGVTAHSLAVTWTAPSNVGSSAITRYDLQWTEWAGGATGAYRWRDGPSVAGTATAAAVEGLSRGRVYRVRVRAANDTGAGGWSAPVEGRTWPAPPRVEWAAFTSMPTLIHTGDQGRRRTYGRGNVIEVTVAFTGEVTWDVSASGSDLRVRLDVGGQAKAATLVRGGETSGTARQLRFRYTVADGDADTDGVKAERRGAGNKEIVLRIGGATLKDAHRDQDADRELGSYDSVLASNPDHKVFGSVDGLNLQAPVASVATLEGNIIAVLFSKALAPLSAAELVDLNFAFFVKGAMGQAADPNAARSPGMVEINGTRVVLHLGKPDVTAAPETIQVFYMPGSGNRILRDIAGNSAPPFDLFVGSESGGQPGMDTTPPRLVRAAVWATGAEAAQSVLRLTFDEPLKGNSVPAAWAFSVQTRNAIGSRPGAARARTLQGAGDVRLAGPDVTVTLDGGVAQDDSVWVSYNNQPDPMELALGPPLQDAAGNDAQAIDFDPVIVVDATPPVLVRGTVSGDGMKVVLYFDEALDEGSTPAAGDFEVVVGTGDSAVTSTVGEVAVTSALAGSGGTDYEQGFGGSVTLTLAAAAAAGDVTVSYTAGASPLRDRAGNRVVSFGAQAVDREAAANPGVPVLVAEEPVVADGALVTLVFDQRLDPASVPARGAFAFYYDGQDAQLLDGETNHGRAPFAVDAVSIEGARVLLRLNGPPPRCLRKFWVEYAPAGEPLRNLFESSTNSNVVAFTSRLGVNRNGLSPGTHPAAFEAGGECTLTARSGTSGLRRGETGGTGGTGSSTGTVNGKRVFVGTDGATGRTTRAPGSAFEVTARAPGGQPRTIAGTGLARMTDGTVAVELAEAVAAGERVTLSYARAAGDPPLRDAEGKVLADFSGLALSNEAPPALSVASVAVVSKAGPDGAYTEGERIEAAVTFSTPVRVDTANGTPTLALIVDSGAGGATVRRASYASGSGSKRLVLAYTVTKADGSLRAARVAASGLKPGGGAIASAADGTPALLAFGSAPGVTGLSVATEDDGRWDAGDILAVTLRFAEPVTVAGAPSVGLVLGSAARRAAYTGGSGSNALTFGYTLTDGDGARNTVEVQRDSLALGSGGSIRSAGGGLAAALAHNAAAVAMMPPPPEPARFVSAAVAPNGKGVMLTFSKPIMTAGRHNHYTVTVDGAARATRGATWADGTVGLVLAEPVRAGETVTVSYANPGDAFVAALLDADGAAVADFGPVAVENAVEAAPPEPEPLTAAFVGVPAEHDGKTAFAFELRFSENFPGRLPYKVLKDHALQVTNGRAVGVRRAAPGQNQRWTITVRPWSVDDVTVTLPAATDCAAPGSVCTQAGRKLANTATARILGPALISVADAEAREGADEAVEFAVTLNRAASGTVTVDYATADGTAVAGEDYTATSGTLSFAAGEREKTVAVPILDDGHDEGKETFLLRLSNAQGAHIADGEAVGTIVNADPIPKAWLARFGRTVTGQVLDAVEARLAAPRQAGARAALAGQALPSWAPGSGSGAGDDGRPDRASLAESDRGRTADAMRRWMAFANPDDGSGPGRAPGSLSGAGFGAFGSGSWSGAGSRPGLEARPVTQRELLTGTSFALSAQAGGPGGGFGTLWGRGAIASFDGREGDLTLDGEVTTGLLGADWASDPDGSGAGRWMAGFAVGHSTGTGGYRRGGCASSQAQPEPNCGGKIEATLTGVYPYAGAHLSDRLSVWLAAGHGAGEVTVRPDGRAALKADLAMTMGAAGMRSDVLKPADGGGLALAVKGDARFTRTASEAVRGRNGTGNLAAAEADVWLVRTGIEGSRRFALPGSGTGGGKADEKAGGVHVTPSFELGLRLDGGDAETGFGADLGGGLAFADPGSGLTLDLKARALAAHEASGFREWGASGSVAWDPRPSTERGLALSLTQSWGASPSGGMDALLSRETLAGIAANDDGGGGRFEAAGRLEGEIGYGLPAFGGAFTGTPNVGFELSDGGARDWRIGWRLTSAVRGDRGFEVSLDATRREAANDAGPPEHGATLRAAIRW